MNPELSLFKLYLNSVVSMDDRSFDLCKDFIEVREAGKNQFLIQEGDKSDQIYFVISGLLRTFHLKNGIEVNSCFCAENSIACSFESFIHGTTSKEYIQTIEATKILRLSKSTLENLTESSRAWSDLQRQLTQLECLRLNERISAMNFATASEKYEALMLNQPELVRRVPVQYLASYLGISRETMSRVRAKLG